MSSLLRAAPPAKKTEIPAGLQTAIEASRHAVEPDGAGFKANNPKQNMDLRFEQTAASVRLPDADVRLRLAGSGRASKLEQPLPAKLNATANRVEYRRGVLTEWYVNDKRGLEQGFTLRKRPAGAGNLVVALAVEGGLTPRLEGKDAVLLERNGAAILRYGGLKAWDARGQILTAQMEVHGSEVRLTVDDASAIYPVMIDPWLQQAKLTAPAGVAGDGFGVSAALDGDTAIIGDLFQENQGAVYVYVRSGTVWTQQAKLSASDRAPGDDFGWAVALSGDTALVGDDFKAGGTGAAYVFVRSGTVWTEQAKLTAPDGVAGDSFGYATGLNADTAVVGAYGKTGGAGAAYVYVRSGNGWTEQAKLTASDGVAGDNLGQSVGVTGDSVLVGAPLKARQTGAVYVYGRSGPVWTEQAKLAAPDGAPGDQFGAMMTVNGDTALVSAWLKAGHAGAAYVYVRNGNEWAEQAKLTASDTAGGDELGFSVALNGDTALVGAWGKAKATGAVYVYRRSAMVWTEQGKLTASDGARGDHFGSAVAVSGDTAAVGASGVAALTGAAYFFTNFQSTANLAISPGSGFPGASVMLSGSGFAPFETVNVHNYSNGLPLGTGFADSSGSATVTVRVPAAPWGRYDVVATGETSGKSGTAPFSVTPRLVLTPNTGTAGGTASARGYGFGAGETVKVYWYNPNVQLFTVTADGHGSLPQFTFTVPASAPLGANAVIGKGQTTLAIGKGQFKVQ